MFKYEKDSYDVVNDEDKSYYELIFHKIFGLYSPFEVDTDVDFPKKDELGGVVLRFVGGGAAYFKIQRKMPSKGELQDIFDICKFLQKSFGEYVVARIYCEPHIEIRNIKVKEGDNIDIDFVSSRRNDGDKMVDYLIEKLEKDDEFTIDNHIQKLIVPFMRRKDEEEFQSKYLRLCELYNQKDLKLPSVKDLSSSGMFINRIF